MSDQEWAPGFWVVAIDKRTGQTQTTGPWPSNTAVHMVRAVRATETHWATSVPRDDGTEDEPGDIECGDTAAGMACTLPIAHEGEHES